MTVRGLAGLQPGEWASDPGARGAGRLQARKQANGITFYYRYSAPDGSRIRVPLGTFSADGKDGLSLAEARAAAGKLSRRYQAGDKDLRGAIEDDDRERVRAEEAQRRAQAAEEARKSGTFGTLLSLYVDGLEAAGKVSADEVRGSFRRHVEERHPRLWKKPALDITPEDGVDILHSLVKAGTPRQADKVRAAMRAAFSVAVRSHTNASASPDLRALAIRSNPFAELAPVGGPMQTRDRALSVAELRAYWLRINQLPEPDGAALRFHLLTGAQRVEQLARATVSDWDRDSNILTLLDGKGRRKQPRRHPVPLLPDAVTAIEVMREARLGGFVFTLTGGLTACPYHAAALRVRDVAAAMLESEEADAPFTIGDLRRTVETRLAALGVSMEIRARLQSHGLGGIQARHYDRHDYMGEVRGALEQLHELVTGTPAKVTTLRRRRA
jgi:hypothetical protein